MMESVWRFCKRSQICQAVKCSSLGRVSEVTRASDEMLIILAVSKIPWEKAFRTMTVDFGGTNAEYEVRQHGELRRREAEATSTTTDLAYKPIPIPTNTPEPKSSNYNGKFDVKYGPEISFELWVVTLDFSVICQRLTFMSSGIDQSG